MSELITCITRRCVGSRLPPTAAIETASPTTHEHEETARLQRLRRDTPWFAAYRAGLDARDTHRRLGVA